MTKPHTQKEIRKCISEFEKGKTNKEVSLKYGISISTLCHWRNKDSLTGEYVYLV